MSNWKKLLFFIFCFLFTESAYAMTIKAEFYDYDSIYPQNSCYKKVSGSVTASVRPECTPLIVEFTVPDGLIFTNPYAEKKQNPPRPTEIFKPGSSSIKVSWKQLQAGKNPYHIDPLFREIDLNESFSGLYFELLPNYRIDNYPEFPEMVGTSGLLRAVRVLGSPYVTLSNGSVNQSVITAQHTDLRDERPTTIFITPNNVSSGEVTLPIPASAASYSNVDADHTILRFRVGLFLHGGGYTFLMPAYDKTTVDIMSDSINPLKFNVRVAEDKACTYTLGTWSTCNPVTRTQTKTDKANNQPCTGDDPKITTRSCTPACTYTEGVWSACDPITKKQTRTDIANNQPCIGTDPKITTRSCTPPPIACTWTCGDWGVCNPTTKKQTRVCTKSPSGCVGTNPYPTSQSCTPGCTWTCSTWGACNPTTRTQTRTCTKSPSGCTGTNPNPTTQSCTPACTYTEGVWSVCDPITRKQTRVDTANNQPCIGTDPKVTTQSCTPGCTWTCGEWGTCNPTTKTQTRVCTKSPSGCTGTNPNPTTQSCEVPCIDIGLRIKKGGQAIVVAVEPESNSTSPLRISKMVGGVMKSFGIRLVEPNDPDSIKTMIKIGGVSKSLARCVVP